MSKEMVKRIFRIFLMVVFVFFFFGCDEIERMEKEQEQEKIQMEKNASWLSVQILLKKDGIKFYLVKDTRENVDYLLVYSPDNDTMSLTKMEKNEKEEYGY
ncbi:MAG: hypothetical protein WC495_07035 [Patescibacteria group bacterium]|jgi:hypothetical protein